MTNAVTRALTSAERSAVKALEFWEELVDTRHVSSVWTLTSDALDECIRRGIAQPLSLVCDKSNDTFEVRFDLCQTYVYLQHLCQLVGLTDLQDGTARAHDGMIVRLKNSLPNDRKRKVRIS